MTFGEIQYLFVTLVSSHTSFYAGHLFLLLDTVRQKSLKARYIGGGNGYHLIE